MFYYRYKLYKVVYKNTFIVEKKTYSNLIYRVDYNYHFFSDVRPVLKDFDFSYIDSKSVIKYRNPFADFGRGSDNFVDILKTFSLMIGCNYEDIYIYAIRLLLFSRFGYKYKYRLKMLINNNDLKFSDYRYKVIYSDFIQNNNYINDSRELIKEAFFHAIEDLELQTQMLKLNMSIDVELLRCFYIKKTFVLFYRKKLDSSKYHMYSIYRLKMSLLFHRKKLDSSKYHMYSIYRLLS